MPCRASPPHPPASTWLTRYQRMPRTRPFFDMGNSAATSCLLNKLSTHRITGGRVDSKVLLKGAYSADQRPAVRGIGDQAPGHWSNGASLTLVLVLSLGFWAAIWRAIAFLV